MTCEACDDIGWITVPEHAPGCDGYTCEIECPIPVQVACPSCAEPTDRAPTLESDEPF